MGSGNFIFYLPLAVAGDKLGPEGGPVVELLLLLLLAL